MPRAKCECKNQKHIKGLNSKPSLPPCTFYAYTIMLISNGFKVTHQVCKHPTLNFGLKKNTQSLREAAKKSSSTNGRAIKRGGGVKAGPLRKKELFL